MSVLVKGSSSMRTEFVSSEIIGTKIDSKISHSGSSSSVPTQPPSGPNYREEVLVGNGAYGTVYKARDLNNPDIQVALKKVHIKTTPDKGVPVSVLREIAIVKQVDRYKHPNVVRFLDVCNGPPVENSFSLYLVFEYVETDLGKFIKTAKTEELTPSKIRDLTFQILCGIDFLHFQRVVHRDLKPQNLLITEKGQVKLADFGLAKIYDCTTRLTNVVVTLWYRPPEVILGCSYETSVDIWSLGCIFAEFFRRTPLFPGISEKNQLETIFNILGTPVAEVWPKGSLVPQTSFKTYSPRPMTSLVPGICVTGLDFLLKCLSFDPLSRPSASSALKHPFFKGLSPPTIQPAPWIKFNELKIENKEGEKSSGGKEGGQEEVKESEKIDVDATISKVEEVKVSMRSDNESGSEIVKVDIDIETKTTVESTENIEEEKNEEVMETE